MKLLWSSLCSIFSPIMTYLQSNGELWKFNLSNIFMNDKAWGLAVADVALLQNVHNWPHCVQFIKNSKMNAEDVVLNFLIFQGGQSLMMKIPPNLTIKNSTTLSKYLPPIFQEKKLNWLLAVVNRHRGPPQPLNFLLDLQNCGNITCMVGWAPLLLQMKEENF